MAEGKGDDNSLHSLAIGWMIMLVIFAVILWLIWFHFDDEIRNIVRWIRYGEIWIVNLFIQLFENVGLMEEGSYRFNVQGRSYPYEKSLELVKSFQPETMGGNHMSFMTKLAMPALKVPFAIIFALMAIWLLFKGPRTHFRKELDLEGLIKHQAQNFPMIRPILDFNPADQPPRPPGEPVPAELPDFAEALGPEEWVAYNGMTCPDGQLEQKRAKRALIRQLGKRWRGWRYLENYKQILLAAFCLKASRKRTEADDMLGRLALCWSHKNGLKLSRDRRLLSEARKVLKTKKIAEDTLKCCNQHAFETTALMRALVYAREEGGVLAPAMFLWLRAHNRALWYPLNNLGRHSFHMEAIGAMSHFKRENRTKRPIPMPKVEDALETITEYLASKKARPIPALDYKDSKKRGIKKAV